MCRPGPNSKKFKGNREPIIIPNSDAPLLTVYSPARTHFGICYENNEVLFGLFKGANYSNRKELIECLEHGKRTEKYDLKHS